MTRDHIIAYKPTTEFQSKISEFATPVTEWDNEIVYKLNVSSTNDALKNSLRNLSFSNVNMKFSQVDIEDIGNQYKFKDIYKNSHINDIIEKESPGGDIRKYITNTYGFNWSLKFKFAWSWEHSITAFEPISIESVQELVKRGVLNYNTLHERYPSPAKIIEWSNIVNNKWGLDCGAMGTLHFRDDIDGGFDGFVIYGADEEVLEWAKEMWGGYEYEDEPKNDIFMKPHEFDMYDMKDIFHNPINEQDLNYDCKVIRLWWD